jgi:hypothetical protein
MDEFDPAIGFILQAIENFAVEYKNRQYGSAAFKRMIETGVVFQPQITSEPKNSNLLFHRVLSPNKSK